MSSKGHKKIRKFLRNEMKGQVRVEAKWRFPVLFTQFFWTTMQFPIDNKYKINLPWIKVVKTNKDWFEIKKFPPRQFRFKFRFIREVKMKDGNKLNVSN